jgi:hypothetical protein
VWGKHPAITKSHGPDSFSFNLHQSRNSIERFFNRTSSAGHRHPPRQQRRQHGYRVTASTFLNARGYDLDVIEAGA